ncbi:hypothetical protein H312_02632 [Anncaliia algerae PRA339]|uniref:Uncharacterized protein n=1 Tax=Anncaliia algerae PRA339 TaxID=1288291 RepID=A0A059EY72_9MICR|nr:hypothetical protein H312_02623 [Anncaliia algerae PRA339]KCZ79983.1 hypothetical protein H312_02632 [Anncaliia algerae PRA339]
MPFNKFFARKQETDLNYRIGYVRYEDNLKIFYKGNIKNIFIYFLVQI